MAAEPRGARGRSGGVRLLIAWLLTALIVGVYFSLPDGDDAPTLSADGGAQEQPIPARIEVTAVTPADATPGSAITVQFAGAVHPEQVTASLGKSQLTVLSRQEDALVVRLPQQLSPGHFKLRVADGQERSKPYDLRVKLENWRKPFRSLVGGFALLVFGIGVLGRGAREAVGLRSTHALARWAHRGPAALGMGIGLGALSQSTTAAASVLSGLVTGGLLALGPAAAAFLGAQLGTASAPLLSGLFDPREGLLVVALAVMWLAFTTTRRGTALARLTLGVGLIAFGLQTLRPGFEPFVQDPTLLSVVLKLRATDVVGVATCALLGAALVAIFQGPAPVCVLVLVLAQTTAQWDLRTALSVLAGSGLGAAVGATLGGLSSKRSRKLLLLNLALGLASTLLAASLVDVAARIADLLVPGVPHEVRWGKRVLLPHLGVHLGVAFALSQLSSALLLLPATFPLARLIERWFPQDAKTSLPNVGDAARVTQSRLLEVCEAQLSALAPLRELVLAGDRDAGQRAEHALGGAQALLDDLIAGPMMALGDAPESRALRGAALTSVQLQRSLEGLERQAARFVDARVALSGDAHRSELAADDISALEQMHDLLASAGEAARDTLRDRSASDLDSARAREIAMNAIEARLRKAVLEGGPQTVRSHLLVLKLADAYEAAGNQLYRLSEALSEGAAEAPPESQKLTSRRL
ncbi:MAG: transporter [Polyangiaceae bacterium]|nr:transporter [Polyangiaceae bacterium]